jgi:hypothetical protein
MNTPQPSDLELRQLPDSADARLFVELASYQADLTESRAALSLAIAALGDDGPMGNTHHYLVGYAAVAYCRTYFPSKVRTPMTDHLSIPEEHAELHTHITDYRNRRVAHSQSQLTSTFAFVGLDVDGTIRPGVIAMTASQEIPIGFLKPWIALIDLISERILGLLTEVETRIIREVAAKDTDEVRAWAMWPARAELPDSAFTAKSSRGRYPTEWTSFWSNTD